MTAQLPPSGSKSVRTAFWFVALGVFLSSLLLFDHLSRVQMRLEHLESARLDEILRFRQNLEGVEEELHDVRGELEATFHRADAAARLSDRLRTAEAQLGDIGVAIEAQATSLSQLESYRDEFGPHVLEEELRARDERLMQRWEQLQQLVQKAQELAYASQEGLARIDATLAMSRDLRSMWRELVGPVVQLAGETSVGSGVLLSSVPSEEGFRTHLLTAWHVVRDIQGSLDRTHVPVPVHIYNEDGSVQREEAELLAFDPGLDAALLELETDEPFEYGARLAARQHLSEVRIFDEIYAVGCPLGNDPIPTNGEVATTHHMVDGDQYWMINAPTYIGNSGGGIFDAETHELVGIFSKIYTHGTLRPTIVPHMGLVTPLDAIYDWLDSEGFAEVERRAMGERLRRDAPVAAAGG